MITDTNTTSKNEQKPVIVPEGIELIDECFYVEEKYGLWISILKDGEKLVTSFSKQMCIEHTQFYLKGRQDGWDVEQSRVINDGKVGGKL